MGEAKALRKEVKARLESESGGCMRLRDGRRGDHSHGKSRGQRVRDRSAVPGAYVSPLTPRTDARQWAATRHSAAPGAPNPPLARSLASQRRKRTTSLLRPRPRHHAVPPPRLQGCYSFIL